MKLNDIIRKITSRKFIAAIGGFLLGLLVYLGKTESEANQITGLVVSGLSILAYIFAEGAVDAAREGANVLVLPEEYEPPEEIDE